MRKVGGGGINRRRWEGRRVEGKSWDPETNGGDFYGVDDVLRQERNKHNLERDDVFPAGARRLVFGSLSPAVRDQQTHPHTLHPAPPQAPPPREAALWALSLRAPVQANQARPLAHLLVQPRVPLLAVFILIAAECKYFIVRCPSICPLLQHYRIYPSSRPVVGQRPSQPRAMMGDATGNKWRACR